MEINFEEIFLYSQKPEKIYHFLSFLLDVEAEVYEEHKIIFRFDNVHFVILPTDKKRIDKNEHFSLSVAKVAELEDLKNNIEFYYYKEQENKYECHISASELHFTDPDGRKWLVKLRVPLTNYARSHESNSYTVS